MKIKCFAFLILLIFGFGSCVSDHEDIQNKRTILIYMAAENSLSAEAYANLKTITEGSGGNRLLAGNLIVYLDPADAEPQLIQIKQNGTCVADKQVVKSYPEQNSASPDVMSSVINDALELYPAGSYGLILWSHGTAWLPYNANNMLKSFGQDGANWMELNELATALPNNTFDFIIFDACYMSSIEVAYPLRNKAKYIVASPTEILGNGFPYNTMINILFRQEGNEKDLKAVCDEFYNYYNAQTGLYKSATISLLSTASLDELTSVSRSILYGKEDIIASLSVKEIQPMDYLSTKYHTLFDLNDFISRVATTEQYSAFQKSLNRVVLYKQNTPNASYAIGRGSTLPMNHFSGLSVYVPQTALTTLNDWYKTLDWYKAVYQ